LPALAAEMESCNKITVRQTGSKGEEKEVHIIFSEAGITSDRDVQEKEALREVLEAEDSVQFEFSKENDYGLHFIDVCILLY
jgi:hypothetical protein